MTASENHTFFWQPAPAATLPPPGSIHLYLVNLDHLVPKQDSGFSPEEVRRMGRYHFAKDRNRFASARAALREILASYLGCRPGEVKLLVGPHGKPALAGSSSLRFNLSHSGHHMLLAVTTGSEVGVDLEMVREDMEMEPLAEHYFSPAQQWEFRIARGRERVWKFFEIWTTIEARLKAGGKGLIGHSEQPDERWNLRHLRIVDRFAASIATEHPEPRLECWTWPS
ncbi:MAG: 4'-phosphopantetheinyl transferase superfamily protein [Chthoniobacteraceae bacterium]